MTDEILKITDEELIQQLKLGDKEAFDTLVKRYEKLLIVIVYSILDDVGAAQDEVQECFLKFWLKFENGEFELAQKGSVKAYLVKCVRNKSFDILRKRHITNNVDVVRLETNFTKTDVSDQVNQQQELEILSKCFSQLSLKQREVYILYLLGWKNKEISKELKLTPSAIVNRKNKAIEKIKLCFQKWANYLSLEISLVLG